MNVKVRDALADAIVHGNESSVGLHCCFNGARQRLYVSKKRTD